MGRLSLRFKLTLLVISVVALASFAFGRFAYAGLGNLLTQSTGVGAETAAQALADSIDGGWLVDFDPKAGLDNPEYRKLESRLETPLRRGTIALLSVVRVDRDSKTVTFVASLPADGSDDYSAPGTVQAINSAPVFEETQPGHIPTHFSRPGFYMAGWAPIMKGDSLVGLVLVATDVTQVKSTLNTISLAIAGMMLAVIFLAGVVAFKFATNFEKTAVTDGLMGIYNHKFFKQRLEQEVAKAARYGQQTSLVMLDIDFFKKVNDSFGHATGDLVLKNLAKWVLDSSRNTDVVARYGGEEVGIILTHTGLAGAQEFAERLRLKVSQQIVKDPEEDAEFRITVSIGVAQWEKGVNMLDLIKRADAALYHSKHTGRNRVTIYQDDILPAPDQPTTKTGS